MYYVKSTTLKHGIPRDTEFPKCQVGVFLDAHGGMPGIKSGVRSRTPLLIFAPQGSGFCQEHHIGLGVHACVLIPALKRAGICPGV
jgi:hypothetical protein